MGLNVLPTHCEAGACGGLYGPSDVENRETDSPLTTAVCIQTHPRRGALPVMATCPIYIHTNMNALRIVQATHTPRATVHDTSVSYTWDYWDTAEALHLSHCLALEGQMCTLTMKSKSK